MANIDFSDVWAYAFSYRGMNFLYGLRDEEKDFGMSRDIVLVGGLRDFGEVVEIRNSKMFELDVLRFLKLIYQGSVEDLIKDFYREYFIHNPEKLKDRRFKLENVFGKVYLGEGVEEIRVG